MRKGKIREKFRSLSVKMNILIIAIILSISVLLLAFSNSAYRRNVLEAAEQRLESIELPQERYAPYLAYMLPYVESEEFSKAREKSKSGEREDRIPVVMSRQPSAADEESNMLLDWIGMIDLADRLWEVNDLKSFFLEACRDGKTYRIYSKVSREKITYAAEADLFGTPEPYFADLSAGDYGTPKITRTDGRDLYIRCARYELDGGGEWRAWMTYDMTDLIADHRRFLVTSILLVLGLTAAAVTVSMLLMRRFVTRPIRDLAKATADFVPEEDGTYSADRIIRVNTGSRDEIGDLSRDVQAMEERIAADTADLTRMTAERERIRTEMDTAREIQRSMLPREFPAFPERTEFDLYASMTPAREVGGDFYDFFLTDEDHLALVIADVSGKGMPAAMFMSVAKALIRNQLKTGCDPAQAMTRVNAQLYEQNDAMMFVTVWAAVISLSTGRGTACNAGHENPGVRRAGGDFELLRYKHDPMAGVRKTAQYHPREFALNPGDCLFVYTDGVTEANNAEKEMFGEGRLAETLNRDPDAGAEELIRRVHEAADDFAGSAPQYDDLTMLCFRYLGPPAGTENRAGEITVSAAVDQVKTVTRFVNEHLPPDCPERARVHVDVAIDEIFSNISHYAYGAETGTVTVRTETEPGTVTVTFLDRGTPFDPLTAETPDTTKLPKEERPVGGLGLYMVKKIMDEVSYEYRDGQNILTLRKRTGEAPEPKRS